MLLSTSFTLLLAAAPAPQSIVRERFGNHAIAAVPADGLGRLAPEMKKLAWHLSLAAAAGDVIQFGQTGWDLPAIKNLLEGTYLFGLDTAPDAAFAAQLAEYLKRFYGHGGNHDTYTGQKFVPAFGPDQLRAAALRALKSGAPLGVKDEAALEDHLHQIQPALFDAAYEPVLTAKTPPPGEDLLTGSSNTFYGKDVTLKDVEGFQEHYPLNSRVVKVGDKLVEQVWRAGTPDKKVPPGLYAEELGRVVGHLEGALRFAQPKHKPTLNALIRYLQTGEPKDWDAYNIAWLKADPTVDATVGFIESYVDARGRKGFWEALINVKDPEQSRVMEFLGKRAQYFEQRMPWPDAYKRKGIARPVAKAIQLVSGPPQPPAGINLPNELHIREAYGSKSVLITNVSDAAMAVQRLPMSREFAYEPQDPCLSERSQSLARKLKIAFHEVIGHASGKTDPKVKDVAGALREYDNTLEEARADLVAFHHIWDPSLKELYPDHELLARALYTQLTIDGMTQLRRTPTGDQLEEDHQRGLQMTLMYLVAKDAVTLATKEGKHYWQVKDLQKMRAGVAELLGRLMVIKATGDHEGIADLVQRYGVRFDPKLRDEVVARVKRLEVPTVLLMSYPRMVPSVDGRGTVTDVKVEPEQDFLLQHLERSLLGSLPPGDASRVAAKLSSTPASLKEHFQAVAFEPRKSKAPLGMSP